MSKTKTFTGSVTAVNTATSLTAQGSVTPILTVPGSSGQGNNRIKRIVVAAGGDFLALGNAVFFIRLGGGGIQNGEQQIMVGAGGGQIVTTAQSAIQPLNIGNGQPTTDFGDVDIVCNGGGELIIQAEMAETDIGSVGIGVTLEFEHD